MEQELKKALHEVANQYDFPEQVDIQMIKKKKGRLTKKMKTWMLFPATVCLALVIYSVIQIGANDSTANLSTGPIAKSNGVMESATPQTTSTDTSISPSTSDISSGSWLDTFQWGGASYVTNFNVSIAADQIGEKVGAVKFKVIGSGKDPSYILQDGDATMLEAGTEIFKVKDSENLAVKGKNGWILYEKLK